MCEEQREGILKGVSSEQKGEAGGEGELVTIRCRRSIISAEV